MKKYLIIVLIACSILLSHEAPVKADWVWTKETGWININKSIRRSIKEIYADAKKAYEDKDYASAYTDYRLLATYFPESRYTEESMFRTAESVYQIGQYNSAYRFFKDYLAFYPGSKRTDMVIGRMHNIGKAFLHGRKYDTNFMTVQMNFFKNREAGVTILSEIISKYPYNPEAEKAQFTIADYYFDRNEYDKAIKAYQTLLDLYNSSSQRDQAYFRIGESYFRSYEGAEYSHEMLPKAHEAFRQYMKRFPQGSRMKDAAAYIQLIENTMAKKELAIARFYHKTKQVAAAVVTLESLRRRYPNTKAANAAQKLISRWENAAKADKATKDQIIAKQKERNSAKHKKNIKRKEERRDRLKKKIK